MSKYMTDRNVTNNNLLINSDWTNGIVNQRGQTVYNYTDNVRKLCIDHWFSTGTLVETHVNYVYMKKNRVAATNDSYVTQYFPSPINGDEFTVYIKIKNLWAGTLSVYIEGANAGALTITKAGEYTHTFKNITNGKGLTLRLIGFEGDIERIKLEKGDVYTGMPAFSMYEEFNKCLPYFNRINGIRAPFCERSNESGQKHYSFSIPRMYLMRKEPIVSVDGNLTINSTEGICLRNMNNVNNGVPLISYSFEVREWEIVVRVTVPENIDVLNTDVQLFISKDFGILLDAYDY